MIAPRFRQVVLDTTDARRSAEFYRSLLGYEYRAGDAPPDDGDDPRGRDWLVLLAPEGAGIAFQQVDRLPTTTWPHEGVPQQLHLDLSVDSDDEFDEVHARAIALGATLRFDRSADSEERLRVYADPAGHTFCVFVDG